MLEQVSEPDPAAPKGSIWNKHLLSIDAGNMHYQLDNLSSDNSKTFFATAKALFGEDTNVGQCGHHVSCNIIYLFIEIKISISQCDMSVFFAAIAWRKRAFRKYFSSEDNFTDFHQYCNRLLEAPTVELTHAMQGVIVTWLKSKKEDVAANWFETYWTSEHGNYTNATAGYVGKFKGNNKSAGIESHWKYMRCDTVGVAGSGK